MMIWKPQNTFLVSIRRIIRKLTSTHNKTHKP